jgi:hypothetical protein
MDQVHIIYKTTNLINGKFYIGKHSTYRINDRYLGSGILIKLAIKKYGRENFKKEILFISNDLTECYKKETELVTEDLVQSELCYNTTLGGKGGGLGELNGMYNRRHTPEALEKIRIASLNQKPFTQEIRDKISHAHKGKITSEETKRKISIAKKGIKESLETRQKKSLSRKGKRHSSDTIEKIRLQHIGRKLSDETKRKLSISAAKKIGEKNPNFRPLSIESKEFIKKYYLIKSINWIKTNLPTQPIGRCRIVREISELKKIVQK